MPRIAIDAIGAFAAVHESEIGTSRHLVRCSGMSGVGE